MDQRKFFLTLRRRMEYLFDRGVGFRELASLMNMQDKLHVAHVSNDEVLVKLKPRILMTPSVDMTIRVELSFKNMSGKRYGYKSLVYVKIYLGDHTEVTAWGRHHQFKIAMANVKMGHYTPILNELEKLWDLDTLCRRFTTTTSNIKLKDEFVFKSRIIGHG